MKKINCIHIYYILISLLLVTSSCADEYAESNGLRFSLDGSYLGLSASSLRFDSPTRQSKTVNVKSHDVAWEFSSSNSSWATLSPSAGTASTDVSVTVEENTSAYDTVRVSPFTLRSTKENYSHSELFSVIQKMAEPQISVEESKLDLEGEASTVTIQVTCNCKWTATNSGNDNWLTFTPTDNTLTIHAEANATDVSRTASILLEDNYTHTATATIEISQKPANITATIKELQFDNSAGTKNVNITSQSPWTAKCSDSWVQVSPTSGNAGTHTLSINVTANSTSETRTSSVIYQRKNGNENFIITVTQTGSTCSFSPENMDVIAGGETKYLTITSNSSWLIETNQEWIKIGNKSGSGNNTVAVTFDANNTPKSRTGIITIYDQNKTRAFGSVQISQAKSSLSVSRSSLVFSVNGGTEKLSITGTLKWSISADAECAEWITLSPNEGTGTSTINVSATKNNTSDTRKGKLELKNENGDVEQTIEISQAYSEVYATPTRLTPTPEGGQETITIMGEADWTLETNSEGWLHLDKTSGTGKEDVHVTIDANKTESTRTGKISLFVDKTRIQQIEVSQDTPQFSTSSDEVSLSVDGTTKTFTVSSNISWTANAPTWITLSPIMGGSGETTLSISANANNKTTELSDKITFKNKWGEEIKQVNVRQAAAGISASPSSFSVNADPTTKTLSIQGNAEWKLTKDIDWITLSKESGVGNDEVTITISENNDISKRTGHIELTCAGNTIQTIAIEQQGANKTEEDYNTGYTYPSVKTTLQLDPIESTSWTASVTDGDSWITLSPKSGDGTQVLNITAADNASGNSREGKIDIVYGEKTTYHIPIYQSGKYLTCPINEVQFFAKGGTSQLYTIATDGTPVFKASEGWITITPNANTGFYVKTTENNTASLRTGTITITLEGVSNLSPLKITVKQAGQGGSFTVGDYGEDEDWNDNSTIDLDDYNSDENWD